mmetsp:Transcript_62020/g.130969  ORF Transcript_62020/g.130969 Transcript_62020/m.130969 type:complete len:311 (-) Transcript_62020:227-1159(-)
MAKPSKERHDSDAATVNDLAKVVHTCLQRWCATAEFSDQIGGRLVQGLRKQRAAEHIGLSHQHLSAKGLLTSLDDGLQGHRFHLLPESSPENLFEPPTESRLGCLPSSKESSKSGQRLTAMFQVAISGSAERAAVSSFPRKLGGLQEAWNFTDTEATRAWKDLVREHFTDREKEKEHGLLTVTNGVLESALRDALCGCGVFEDMADTVEETMLLGAREMASGQPLAGACHLWQAIIDTGEQVSKRTSSEVLQWSREFQASWSDPSLAADDDGDSPFTKELLRCCEADLSFAFGAVDALKAEVRALEGLLS